MRNKNTIFSPKVRRSNGSKLKGEERPREKNREKHKYDMQYYGKIKIKRQKNKL